MRKLGEWLWYCIVTLFLLTVGLFFAILFNLLLLIIPKADQKMKWLARIVLLLLFFVLSTTGYFLYACYETRTLGAERQSIYIRPGTTFQQVADSLTAKHIVGNIWALKLSARLRHIDRKLIVGRYDFSGSNSLNSVLNKFEEGEFAKIRVTIYEGAPLWKVASILAHTMDFDSSEVIKLSRDSAFVSSLNVPSLEGYLFPTTYFFPWGVPLASVIKDMRTLFHQQTESIWDKPQPYGLNKQQVVVLASIVEAEAMLEQEKPIIASVYLNRLKLRMRLDADPTVIYGLGGLSRPLMIRDLEFDTPYNTYRRYGLPPGPINSPGLSAIKAVMQPSQTSFLYFVADGTGGHKFSKTNDEHNRLRAQIKRAKRLAKGTTGGRR